MKVSVTPKTFSLQTYFRTLECCICLRLLGARTKIKSKQEIGHNNKERATYKAEIGCDRIRSHG